MKNLFIISSLILLFGSCSNSAQQNVEECSEKMISMDSSVQTSCPYLTSDTKGNIVLSWVKEINDSTAVMCYAISKDKGFSFEPEVEISVSKNVKPSAENCPKIIFKPSGEIMAIWGVSNASEKKKYGGLVFYSQSFDEGKNWSEAKPLVKDKESIDQRYFDVTLLNNGEVGIVWLDNRSKTVKEGSTLYYAETIESSGFQNEKPIAETCCQCCRTDLYLDENDVIHVAFRDIINDTIRDMVHIVSLDKGNTFSKPERISEDNWVIDGCPHTGPTMASNSNGLHFAWFTAGGEAGVYYSNTKDNGKSFSKRKMLNAEARHPQMARMNDGAIGIVWDETVVIDSMYHSKIVLEILRPDGKTSNINVSAENVNASFPVLFSKDEKIVFVAWVQQAGESNNKSSVNKHHTQAKGKQVFYKMIHLE